MSYRVEFDLWTQQGSVEYGLTDRLSIRGKAGTTRMEFPESVGVPAGGIGLDLLPAHFNYGLAWSAGLQYRICAPQDGGTALALRGQYSQARPDDFTNLSDFAYHDVQIQEWNVALIAGAAHGRVRPYAGIAYSDWTAWFTSFEADAPPDVVPARLEKDKHVGAIVGVDWDLCDNAFLNIEAHAFDESGVSTGVRIVW